jgi:methylglutaconyl-CoA hydratase
MMTTAIRSKVLLEQQDGDLLRLTLNDPKRANALSPALVEALTEVYERDLRARGVRAVLLAAAGKHFSAGADLENLKSVADKGLEENRRDSARQRRLFDALVRQEALTIALVHGACVAGGCGLATACGFVVAADDARFMYSEVRIGFVAALVASYLSLRLRGSDIRELLLNPEFIEAGPALEMGLVNRMVPERELRTAGDELAAQILSKASSESIARTKRILLEVLGRPLSERLDLAAEANAQSRLTDDCRQGVAAFLASKKSPNWRPTKS